MHAYPQMLLHLNDPQGAECPQVVDSHSLNSASPEGTAFPQEHLVRLGSTYLSPMGE